MLPADLSAWNDFTARRALPVQKAYTMALAHDWSRDRQAEVGYRLVWLSDRVLGSRDVTAAREGHAVIGRHASCDVVLGGDLAVSLRHVLVRAAALDDGFPVLRILDLLTGTGFELSDGSRQRSVAATGPIVLRIGAHSIVALPSSGRRDDALPEPAVGRSSVAPRRVQPHPVVPFAAVAPKAAPVSRITVLPGTVELARRHAVVPFAGGAGPTQGYEVVLEARGQRAGVRFTIEDLDHGVLIGQSDKCVDAGLRAILSATISRVHVLLVRENEQVVLYDMASLNGTYVDRRRVRCLVLDEEGSTVNLSGATGVMMSFRTL